MLGIQGNYLVERSKRKESVARIGDRKLFACAREHLVTHDRVSHQRSKELDVKTRGTPLRIYGPIPAGRGAAQEEASRDEASHETMKLMILPLT